MDEWETVIDIMASLQDEGFKPTLAMYTMALGECSKRGHLNRAVDIYNLMPESLRAQLSSRRSLRAVLRGHAYSDSKEMQLRVVNIVNEFSRTISPKDFKTVQEEMQRIIQDEVVRISADTTAKPVVELEEDSSSGAAETSVKGVLGYVSALFKR
ncbi:Pentatricopeptide repeat-containing protein [Phytophthora cinnamomi]|uniref:Pentatricopeptide repeat-containing protein n=1 Tax=Phytophthora cinnamomi TaxID=4785 RepID=UPI0035593F95|nr:Pentatricopeptide repeat-containing protein [Phytophthora cinnamomi]